MPVDCAVVPSPVGPLALEAKEGRILRVRFRAEGAPTPPPEGVLTEAARQLEEYFAGLRRAFTVPLQRPSEATPFQHRAWDALLRIPFGETRTYGEIAREIGSSPRAVGGACARNPLPLFVPCHRVVSATGLGGFGGDWETGLTVDVKAVLLTLEGGEAPKV